jgi:hypothetical protein
MGTITNPVQQHIKRFRQKQIKLAKLTQLGWEDAADCFKERDNKYEPSELRVLAVVQPQTGNEAAAPALTLLGELTECLKIVLEILQMPQGTSQAGCSHIRLASVKPQLNTSIPSFEPSAVPDTSPSLRVNSVETVCFYPCM